MNNLRFNIEIQNSISEIEIQILNSVSKLTNGIKAM